MNFKWHQRLLSYLYDIPLEENHSEYSDRLQVYLCNNRLKLTAGSAIYSEEDNYYNFTEVFKKINIKKLNINKVLVLGLGLGSIPVMLEKKFGLFYNYDLIEIDPAIIRLFQKYVAPGLQSKIQVFERDALSFIQENTQKYDLICVDLFINRIVPAQFTSEEFISDLSKAMNPNAKLIFNRLIPDTIDESIEQEKMLVILKKYFSEVTIINIVSNRMYVGSGFE